MSELWFATRCEFTEYPLVQLSVAMLRPTVYGKRGRPRVGGNRARGGSAKPRSCYLRIWLNIRIDCGVWVGFMKSEKRCDQENNQVSQISKTGYAALSLTSTAL